MESKYEAGEDVPAAEQTASDDEQPRRPSIFQREPADPGDASGDPAPARRQGGDSIENVLKNVAATLEAEPGVEEEEAAPRIDEDSTLPTSPRTLAEIGLSKAFLTDLTLKIMHYSGTPSAAQLMRRLGLGQNMVQQVLSALQEDRLCEVLSQSDLFTGNYRYRLSERGTARASEALERTRYAGPVPVTAEQYAEVIRAQQAARHTLSPAHINTILDEFVLAPAVKDAVARALYSGKTTLFHGPSGNGKTSVLEGFAGSLGGTALVPYAIYAYGQVIRVFDPSIHEPVEDLDERNAVKDDMRLDRRWVIVRRPAVILGSELGPESLDLAYDPQSRFYQAPPHIKAQGGALVVDDLGRQRTESRELLTRWLITVERGWDSLSLITGEKLTVPFDIQLLFGTNRPIVELADDALLRRILYKVEIPSPGPVEFAEILRRLCRQRNVQAAEETIDTVVERLFRELKEPPRAAYARDLLEMVIEGAAYDGREPRLDAESFERALKLFLSQRDNGASA
jgi:predicted ATPase with chaperone activity